jgi:hypothetical protein
MDIQRSVVPWGISDAFGLESSPERSPFLRQLAYETDGHPAGSAAMAINLSSGGVLLLMTLPIQVEQAITVQLPNATGPGNRPTKAVVRWMRYFTMTPNVSLYFVGLQFTGSHQETEEAFQHLLDDIDRSRFSA